MSPGIHFDRYDREIYADPYPTFERMRNEAPLYFNAEYDFDVPRCVGCHGSGAEPERRDQGTDASRERSRHRSETVERDREVLP